MDSGAWKMFCAVCIVLTTLVVINSCSAAEEKKRSVDAVGTYLLKRRNGGEPLDNEPFAVESWQDELEHDFNLFHPEAVPQDELDECTRTRSTICSLYRSSDQPGIYGHRRFVRSIELSSGPDELDQAGRHRAAAAEKRPSDSVGSYLLRRRTADSVGSYLLKRNAKTASASSAAEEAA